jgi:hypothetical protein
MAVFSALLKVAPVYMRLRVFIAWRALAGRGGKDARMAARFKARFVSLHAPTP